VIGERVRRRKKESRRRKKASAERLCLRRAPASVAPCCVPRAGVSEGGALPSTVVRLSCHVRTLERHQCWHPPAYLRRQPHCPSTVGSIYKKCFPRNLSVKKVFHRGKKNTPLSATLTAHPPTTHSPARHR
jgi:hypothetical protein